MAGRQPDIGFAAAIPFNEILREQALRAQTLEDERFEQAIREQLIAAATATDAAYGLPLFRGQGAPNSTSQAAPSAASSQKVVAKEEDSLSRT